MESSDRSRLHGAGVTSAEFAGAEFVTEAAIVDDDDGRRRISRISLSFYFSINQNLFFSPLEVEIQTKRGVLLS